MDLRDILVVVSGLSFLAYGIAYFVTPHLKKEFIRYGLEKTGKLVAVLEILGATGLMVGFLNQAILLVSSGGLALLMLMGVLVRIRIKDSLAAMLPALFFLAINAYIFIVSI